MSTRVGVRIAAAACACLALTTGSVRADTSGPVVVLQGVVRGVYRVKAGTTVIGAPGATVIGQVILEHGSTIRGVEVTGWADRRWNFSAGIRVAGDGVTIADCTIHDGPSHGIQVTGGHVGTRIVGNRIVNVGEYTATGSSIYPVANWRGISLEADSDHTVVAGNTIVAPYENGIFEYASTGVVIVGNTITAYNRGLVDRWNAGSGNGIEALSHGTVVAGNVIDGAAPSGAVWGREGIVAAGNHSVIARNVVSNATASGIHLIGGGLAAVVEGNVVRSVALVRTDAAGIRLLAYEGSRLGTVIDANDVAGARSGIGIRSGPTGRADATVVTRNALHGLRLVLVGSNNVVAGNS